jgi:hypothetical protein
MYGVAAIKHLVDSSWRRTSSSQNLCRLLIQTLCDGRRLYGRFIGIMLLCAPFAPRLICPLRLLTPFQHLTLTHANVHAQASLRSEREVGRR